MNPKRLLLVLAGWLLCTTVVHADIYKRVEGKDVNGTQLYVGHLTLYPAPEPVPAMKYRLLTDPAYRVDQNANIFYLKAGGFFEQSGTREALNKKYEETEKYRDSEDPKERRKCLYNWFDLSPDELPMEDVKEVLGWLSFQSREMREAEKCSSADFGHRNVFEKKDPFSYMLPEIQSMRAIARWQSIRCKVAIREGRIDDAIQILRQQYMMSMHLGQDLFIVSQLVGISIGGITDENLLYLIQRPDCPSLYWALAAMPRSMCDVQYAVSSEKRNCSAYFPYHQKLCDPNATFLDEFWPIYAEEVVKHLTNVLLMECGSHQSELRDIEARSQAAFAGYVVAAYPKAKRYLIEEVGLSRRKVESFPSIRVVAMVTSLAFEDLFDVNSKIMPLPPDQAHALYDTTTQAYQKRMQQIGLAGILPYRLTCAFLAYNNAVIRQQQNFNISQTVEALRIYAYHHDGKLPESLEGIYPPAQKNPFTGKHFPYRLENGKAILDAPGSPGYHRRLIIEMKPIVKK
ncbi:MAG: hypothetical protein PVH19_00400 [Planctomycetia bacterium]|jgi:hypothetical protein